MHAPRTITRHERLQKSAEVLTLIDNCRRVTGDVRLGAAIERLIIQRELYELEDGALPSSTGRPAMVDREVVIPVKRVVDR